MGVSIPQTMRKGPRNNKPGRVAPRTGTGGGLKGASPRVTNVNAYNRGPPSPVRTVSEDQNGPNRLNISQLQADIASVASGAGLRRGEVGVPASSTRADRLAELAGGAADAPYEPSTLSTWRGAQNDLNRDLLSADAQRQSTSEQLKGMLEENLRLKMTSETIKDELNQKGAELETRTKEAGDKKSEVNNLQQRASQMDSAYREKVNELRRYSDITSDLKMGIDRTDEELLRAEGDLQVKNEVAVRMKAKIDEMLVEIERVSVLNEHKSQELDTLKSEAIALGSKHEALEAEYTIKSEEVKQWSEERARLESANGQLEGSLNGAGSEIENNTAEVARLNEATIENETSLRSLKQEPDRLDRTVEVAKASYDETEEEKSAVQTQVEGLGEELDTWQSKLEGLQSQVATESELITQLEQEADKCAKAESNFNTEPLRLSNELGWIEERLQNRKLQESQTERQAIIAAEQLDVLKREFGSIEVVLKKQVEETEKYKQMVADMVGYSTGASDGERSEVPSDLLNDPIVLKYKSDAERMRQQVKASDVDIEGQRAELKRWKEMSEELESQVSSRQEELRRVSMDLKVKKEVGLRLKAKSQRLDADINDVKAS